MLSFSSQTHWVAVYPIITDTKFSKVEAIPKLRRIIDIALGSNIQYLYT